MTERVVATETALALIRKLREQHGPLMFHQSGGCCDGSAANCYREGELMVLPQRDRLLGTLGGVPFYISHSQYETWKQTQLVIDVVPGRGGTFSLEGPEGLAFITRSRLFTAEELTELESNEADSG
jgi:uncharacterized protein (DUF779 family)